MSKSPRPLGSVSDTAYWVAYCRAAESERSDALFRDPYARRLTGEHGDHVVKSLRRVRSSLWAMIVRTAIFDEIIINVVKRASIGLVLNLASGLDTRPYRLPLPATLDWVEADLPEIIAYKQEKLRAETPVCKLERIAIDLRHEDERRRMLARLGQRATRALAITEGLLVYLAENEVRALARDVHAVPSFRVWLTDIASPKVLRVMNRSWGKQLRAAGAPFRFGPAEGSGFFRPLGWREIEFRNFLEESRRLNRPMPMDKWIRFWERVAPRRTARRLAEWRSGALLLERMADP